MSCKKPSENEYKKQHRKTFLILFWRSLLIGMCMNRYSYMLIIFGKSLPFHLKIWQINLHSNTSIRILCKKENQKGKFWKSLACTMWKLKIENWKDIKVKMYDQKVFQHIVGTRT